MGLSDDGDDSVTPAQTRCSCARVQGSNHDIVALVVSGGAGIEAQFDLIDVCTSGLAGPVRSLKSFEGSSAQGGL